MANRANTVSVGSATAQRQVTNVAAGIQTTDAANLGQVQDALVTAKSYADANDQQTLQTAKAYTDQKVAGFVVNQRLSRVGAMGTAMSQMAFSTQGIDASNRLGVGVGGYQGEAALSVGYSRQLSPKASLTFGAAMSGKEASGGVGVGIGW